ncbi:FeoA family protein [Orenia marismortui]|uniref:Ferrous iron transport protein A n=1 Tax=Orenia marismortui TaxID=46469 RepID=A0A4R8GZZ2_9FIRM|nr:FeoA family protein [Orenia marismortui]TDX52470.1 ferrous iron transport protein A [Orenia marismortui]
MLLTQLPLGESCQVVDLKAEGIKRRRLLDLGLIPGTEVIGKRRSPSGDPTAYLIRGTVIALRSEETSLIEVR